MNFEDTNSSTEQINGANNCNRKNKKKENNPLDTNYIIKRLNRKLNFLTVWLILFSLVFVAMGGHIFREKILFEYAQNRIEKEDFAAAFSALEKIPDYKNVPELMDQHKFKLVGNIVTFGRFEQDNVVYNGTEPLEWVVLDVVDGKALITTLYCIDAHQYRAAYGTVTWGSSDVRYYLNNGFLRSFVQEELDRIVEVTLVTEANPVYGTRGGGNTIDRVFLLSAQEFSKYLENTEYAIGYTTKYAFDRGVKEGPNSGTSVCWLRSTGESLAYVSTVSYVGKPNYMGVYPFSESVGIRPAMWITVEALAEETETQ